MDKAVKEYRLSEAILKEFTEIFPFAHEGELPTDRREQGASLLKRAKSHVVNAISHMKEALDEWE